MRCFFSCGRRRFSGLLMAEVLLLAALHAAGQTGRPRWTREEAPVRLLARTPMDNPLSIGVWRLVQWPADDLPVPRPAGYSAYTVNTGTPVPCEVAFDEGRDLWLRVAIPLADRRERDVRVYAAPPTNTFDAMPQRPDGVAIEIHRVSAISPPSTPERMRFLLQGISRPSYASGAADFESLDIEAAALRSLIIEQENERRRLAGDWSEERRTRAERRRDDVRRSMRDQRWLVIARGFVQAPRAGEYRFELQSASSAFLEVDGQLLGGLGGEEDARTMQTAPVMLDAGIRRLTVMAYAFGGFDVRLRWRPPGEAEGFKPIPGERLLGGWMMDDARVDRHERSIHADFNLAPQPSYQFRGVSDPFTPVRLQNASENWVTHGMTYLWFVNGVPVTNGASPALILHGAGSQAISLEVRDAYGFSHSRTRLVTTPIPPLRAYAVEAALEGVPALGADTDLLRPAITLAGRADPRHVFDVAWSLATRTGTVMEGVMSTVITGATVIADLPPVLRGRLASLHWNLRHAGVVVAQGECLAGRPTPSGGPWRAEGGSLYDGKGRRTFVSSPAPDAADWPAPASGGPRRILCVDDALSGRGNPGMMEAPSVVEILGRLLTGAVEISSLSLPDWSAATGVLAPLEDWVRVVNTVRTGGYDVVVFSVGLHARRAGMTPEECGRHLTALADGALAAGARRVILSTLPATADDGRVARDHAVATRAVAAAYRLAVADLYTTFAAFTAAGRQPLDAQGRLTSEGRTLAAQAMARALLPMPEPSLITVPVRLGSAVVPGRL